MPIFKKSVTKQVNKPYYYNKDNNMIKAMWQQNNTGSICFTSQGVR
jgi:hypothetical protein